MSANSVEAGKDVTIESAKEISEMPPDKVDASSAVEDGKGDSETPSETTEEKSAEANKTEGDIKKTEPIKVSVPRRKKNNASLISASYHLLQVGMTHLPSKTKTAQKKKDEDSEVNENEEDKSVSETADSSKTETKDGDDDEVIVISSSSSKKEEKGNSKDTKKEKKSRKRKESSSSAESLPRQDYLPDRSKSDYYCEVCDSHMNSEMMWQSHVNGKRHLKNLKKEPGESPSKSKVRKTDAVPIIQRRLDEVSEPIVGLDYVTEIQKADPKASPTYNCYLCHSTMTMHNLVEHVTGAKHRLLYLKEVDPSGHEIIENMSLRKEVLASIAADRSAALEDKHGRGHMEVKMEKEKEKSKYDLKRKGDSRYPYDDASDDDYFPSKRPYNFDRNMPWRPSSPDFMAGPSRMLPMSQPMDLEYFVSNIESLPMHTKLRLLTDLSRPLIISDTEEKVVMSAVNSLTQSLMQYKVRNLPLDLKNKLMRHILSGDLQNLEAALNTANDGPRDNMNFGDSNRMLNPEQRRLVSYPVNPMRDAPDNPRLMMGRPMMNDMPSFSDMRERLDRGNMMAERNMANMRPPMAERNMDNMRPPMTERSMDNLRPPMSGVSSNLGQAGNWRPLGGPTNAGAMGMNPTSFEKTQWKRGGFDDRSSFGY